MIIFVIILIIIITQLNPSIILFLPTPPSKRMCLQPHTKVVLKRLQLYQVV